MLIMVRGVMAALTLFLLVCQAQAYTAVENFREDKSNYKVLVFLSYQCPCSQSHIQHLNDLALKYRQIKFYGVITDIFTQASSADIQGYFSSKNFKFPIIKDEGQGLIRKYRALKTPHTVILKKVNSEYKIIYEGGVSDRRDFSQSTKKFLSENLHAISRGHSVKYEHGKSLGCYIRRL